MTRETEFVVSLLLPHPLTSFGCIIDAVSIIHSRLLPESVKRMDLIRSNWLLLAVLSAFFAALDYGLCQDWRARRALQPGNRYPHGCDPAASLGNCDGDSEIGPHTVTQRTWLFLILSVWQPACRGFVILPVRKRGRLRLSPPSTRPAWRW